MFVIMCQRVFAVCNGTQSAHRLRKSSGSCQEALNTGKTIRKVCLEWNVLPPEQLDEVFDP